MPEYKYFIQIKLKYKTIDIIYHQVYTGRRYVLVDNSKYLDEYSLGNLKLFKTFNFKKRELQFQVGVNNIWNVEYQAIWYRPMPGRSCNVTVVLKLKQ